MIKHFTFYLLLAVVFFCFACSNSLQYKQVNDDFAETTTTASKQDIDSITSAIPSYREITKQIQTEGITFSEEVLVDYNTADMYQNSKETALALGIFTADLGYVRHFEKVQLCSDFLQAIQILASKLAVADELFEEYTPIFEANINNEKVIFETIDSLLSKNTLAPAENEKFGISALFVTGFWLEITHLALANNNVNADNDNLANHFKILMQINNLLVKISDSEIISNLKEQMLELENKGYDSQSLSENVEKIRSMYVKTIVYS